VLDALAESPAAAWRNQAEYRLKRIERKLERHDHPRLPIEEVSGSRAVGTRSRSRI
jgi:hypothetical protein